MSLRLHIQGEYVAIPIGASLAVRGITLRPWPRCTDHQMYQWRHYDGLLTIDEKLIHIIAIMTDRPGSGKLHELVDRFEQVADECSLGLIVAPFWSARLCRWFGRRGYTTGESRKSGRFAARTARSLS